MAVYYVRLTGNDANPGTFGSPFLTVTFACTAATDRDIIDVGEGVFAETGIALCTFDGEIRGVSPELTTIRSSSVNGALRLNNATEKFLFRDLTLEATHAGLPAIVDIPSITATSQFTFYRCIFRIGGAQDAIGDAAGNLTGGTIDLIHCNFVSTVSTLPFNSKVSFGVTSEEDNRVNAVNCIFKGLASATRQGAVGSGLRRIRTNRCVFFDNQRDFEVGAANANDLNADPQFTDEVNQVYTLNYPSPARDIGHKLTEFFGSTGHVIDSRVETTYIGDRPDVGVHEFITATAQIALNATNLNLLLQSIADEMQTLYDDSIIVRRERGVAQADALALSRRVGALTASYRPTTQDTEQWRTLVTNLVAAFRDAPSYRLFKVIGLNLLGLEPILYEYWRNDRWALGTNLKIQVAAAHPTLTAQVTEGAFQIFRRWFRCRDTNVVLADNATSVIFCDGTEDAQFFAAITSSTDLTLLRGKEEVNLAGTCEFRPGSNEVNGQGTSFVTALGVVDLIDEGTATASRDATDENIVNLVGGDTFEPNIRAGNFFHQVASGARIRITSRVSNTQIILDEPIPLFALVNWEVLDVRAGREIRATNGTFFHQVETIHSQTRITLKTPFNGAHSLDEVGVIRNHLRVFGTARTLGGDIIRVRTHSTLDSTAFTQTIESKQNGYELEWPLNGFRMADTDDRVVLLRQLLAASKSVDKLGYTLFELDRLAQTGVVIE